MAITTYQELKTKITNTLNRPDLVDDEDAEFVELAEASFRRDIRTEKSMTAGLNVSTPVTDLPAAARSVKTIYHDGDSYFGALDMVSFDTLMFWKAQEGGSTGVPRRGAVLNNKLYVAPEPDTTYSLKIAYDWELPRLSDEATTNWLLDGHPDIYLYGALRHTAPYLKDDTRLQVWETLYEKAMNELFLAHERSEFTGKLVSRPNRALGE